MNKRKIRAIVFFGISMTCLAYFLYWAGSWAYWYSFTESWAPGTSLYYIPGTIIMAVLTAVFLGLYLSTKNKHKMF